MNLKEFVKVTGITNMRPSIVCLDGFNMSVQGSAFHYCSPRENNDVFTAMEIGFPSSKEDLIMKYAEQKEAPTQTVYACVPCSIIQQVINKHGGIDIVNTLKNKH